VKPLDQESVLMKKGTSAVTVKTVDDYLASLPDDSRTTLEKIRTAIKAAAPKASEGISYQMPMYKQNGMVIGFAAFKSHCSIFPGVNAIVNHKDELKGYETSKGTVRFPIGKPLPAALVKKIVKERLAENEANMKKKGKS
jgi:uncharacterized protein YdhG (YjbR/CyaY superfamily)